MEKIRRQKKISQRQEKQAAKDLGANVEANSGATKFGGADGRKVNEIRIECKYTEKDYYLLKLDDLLKLKKQAILGGLEDPVFQIEFISNHPMAGKYAIIPYNSLLASSMYGAIVEARSYKLTLDTIFYWSRGKCREIGKELASIGFFKVLNTCKYCFHIIPWNDYLEWREENERV